MDYTFWIAILGATGGAIGTILGIVNTWHAFSKDRVKLHLHDFFSITDFIPTERGNHQLPNKQLVVGLQILNLSSFPVTIMNMGIAFGKGKRAIVKYPGYQVGDLPRRLEPHDVCFLYNTTDINYFNGKNEYFVVDTAERKSFKTRITRFPSSQKKKKSNV